MASTAVEKSTGLQTIPLSAVFPNVNNPRKHFDQASLKELAKSIESHGILQPLVVRPDPMGSKKFELVAGERRWRAAKIAGKADVPVIVSTLSDREAIEVMVIENLQREDVQPLEEARGYQSLMNCDKDATVESIAAKVGMSVGYVYARLKLTALIPAAEKALDAGEITPGHGILIARLQPDDQEKAFKACFEQQYSSAKGPLIPEKLLRKWIQENIQLNLDKAPFDITDAKLVPTAGACTVCPKRSGTNPALFEGMDLGKNTCMDPVCYQSKKMALVTIRAAAVAKEGEKPIYISHQYVSGKDKQKGVLYESEYRVEFWQGGKRQTVKPKSCKDAKLAIYVDAEPDYRRDSDDHDSGKGAGKTIHVCLNKKCEVHNDKYGSSGGGMDDAAARRNQRIAQHFSLAVFQAIVAKAKKITRADRELIALEFFKKLGHHSETPMLAALGWDKKLGQWNADTQLKKHFAAMKPDELDAVLLYFAIAPDLNARTPTEPRDLLVVASRYKVKTAELLAASKEKFAKKKPKLQTAAKAKKGK